MSTELLKLSYFPDDGRIWRVEWIYDIKYNLAVPSESTFVALIAPFRQEIQEKYQSGAYDKEQIFYRNGDVEKIELKEVMIGVGQSPLIDIGSLWQNGRLLNSNVGVKKTFDLVIDDAHVQYHPGFHKYNYNGAEIPAFPYNQQNMENKGRVVNCIYIQYENDPYHFIIPAHVLINFYLCTSTSLAHVVYNGSIANSAESEIFKPEKSSYSIDKSIFSIYLRMKMHDDDAWVLSRSFCTKAGKKAARIVHDSLMVQSVKGNKYLFPKSIFPFIGPTNLTLCYKPIFCENTKSYKKLVYSIYHCTAPFPFNRVQVIRDATGADEDTDISEEEKKPFQANNKNKTPSMSPMGSREEPSNTTQNNAIDKPENRFGFTVDKPIEKPLKDQCLYKSTNAQMLEDITTNQQGTGQGAWGSSKTSKATINTKRVPLDSSFDTFVEAISKLNEDEDFKASIRPSTEQTKVIPLIKPGKKRQWPYLDSSLASRRAVIVADIEYKSRNFCLIDFKFRSKESYSRAIISRNDFFIPSDETIYKTLIRLAHARGIWVNMSKLPESLDQVFTMKHSAPDINILARNIGVKIKNLYQFL